MRTLPFKIYCYDCQALLYFGETQKAPYEIAEDNNGKYSKCGRKLASEPIGFEVKTTRELSYRKRRKERKLQKSSTNGGLHAPIESESLIETILTKLRLINQFCETPNVST